MFVMCQRVPWYFMREVHIFMLREMWSTQTQDMNLEYLCHVSLRVHMCKSEVINEQYCICE